MFNFIDKKMMLFLFLSNDNLLLLLSIRSILVTNNIAFILIQCLFLLWQGQYFRELFAIVNPFFLK
jgi:hypothetical protein